MVIKETTNSQVLNPIAWVDWTRQKMEDILKL